MHLNFTMKSSFFNEIDYWTWGDSRKQFIRGGQMGGEVVKQSSLKYGVTPVRTLKCYGQYYVRDGEHQRIHLFYYKLKWDRLAQTSCTSDLIILRYYKGVFWAWVPLIHTFLWILVTPTVDTVSAERRFSITACRDVTIYCYKRHLTVWHWMFSVTCYWRLHFHWSVAKSMPRFMEFIIWCSLTN